MRLELLIILIALGIWLIIDGICSIIKYWNQKPIEHLIRSIRAGVGVVLIMLYFLTRI